MDHAAKFQTGDHGFLEGELVYREYKRMIETETGPVNAQLAVTEVILGSISVLNRKEKPEREGGGVKRPRW